MPTSLPRIKPCPWCGPVKMGWNMIGFHYLDHAESCPLLPVMFDVFRDAKATGLAKQWNEQVKAR